MIMIFPKPRLTNAEIWLKLSQGGRDENAGFKRLRCYMDKSKIGTQGFIFTSC